MGWVWSDSWRVLGGPFTHFMWFGDSHLPRPGRACTLVIVTTLLPSWDRAGIQ